MNQQADNQTLLLWNRLVASHTAYSLASMDFLARKSERVGVLRQALRGPDRETALAMAGSLEQAELMEMFPELVHLARCAHSPFLPAWELIASLPRDWVLAHIEAEVDAILQNEEETDYWMFLQLYERLDRDLTLKLARRAAAHADPDIRELGEESLARLRQPEQAAEAS